MLYTIYDIETNGLSRHSDVCQFAYITFDNQLQLVESGQLYFYYDGMQMPSDAQKVHGLSLDFLRQFKGDFEENLKKMYRILHLSIAVGYNSKSFDTPICKNFIKRFLGEDIFPIQEIDMMQLLKKKYGHSLKLVNASSSEGLTPNYINMMNNIYFKKEAQAHDATYDTTATALLFLSNRALWDEVHKPKPILSERVHLEDDEESGMKVSPASAPANKIILSNNGIQI